ncbi:4-hydroxy-tetrahydrodipicolinate reductase [Opitutus sp. GAS368]|jgi:4-hydroxy-tetrahydrodipicolinate reductase|uniref:4-hydroxy-tetrahydrodipicolinate reductase n=1 Tax=Opitutus sp. GAS368 TaxID=1882749 RepID=UPI00087949B5|nr:4-hydroxy-tetrahydrodipicolinate reductase [Opitutus sp. GAS368]SDS57341.1 dihydrodipicolinate reductase [Opitutus sp. GAS368]
MPLQILLNGAKGRMGRTIAGLAGEMDAAIRATTDAGDDPAAHLAGCDVIIDFSSHSATGRLLELAVAKKKPIVIGTTGHGAAEKKKLLALAAKVPCVWAGNFSVGVNLLFALTRRAAAVLGADYDAEVVEMHHRFKKDAPSGTAARLLEIILEERKLTADALRHGRSGITGERPPTEVGVHALRGGDVVGEHTVLFAALGERVELIHKASDRAIFARGAVRAAHWVVKQKPGVYDMQDVLGLK